MAKHASCDDKSDRQQREEGGRIGRYKLLSSSPAQRLIEHWLDQALSAKAQELRHLLDFKDRIEMKEEMSKELVALTP